MRAQLAWHDVIDVSLFQNSVKSGDVVLAAVSGGPDSTALFLACVEAAKEFHFSLRCCYVDHGIRPGAGQRESEFVRKLCTRFEIPFYTRKLPPLDHAPNVGSFEGKLRHLRYAVLRDLAGEIGASCVALGHTANDLVETFLMHLLRGMALTGAQFSAVRRDGDLAIIRPLWKTWRTDIARFLKQHVVEPLQDESNDDLSITRNKIRHLLIPLLEKEFNPQASQVLFGAALAISEFSESTRYCACVMKEKATRAATLLPGALKIPVLDQCPDFLRREILGQWLEEFFGRRVLRTSAEYESVASLLNRPSGSLAVLSGGVVVARVGDELLTCHLKKEPQVQELALVKMVSEVFAKRYAELHPEVPLASLNEPIVLHQMTFDRPMTNSPVRFLTLDGKEVTVVLEKGAQRLLEHLSPLMLRNRRPGDRIGGKTRLKELLIEYDIPFFIRDYLVLLCDKHERPLCVLGLSALTREILRRSDLPDILPVSVRSPVQAE